MKTIPTAHVSLDVLFERCIPIPFSGCWVWNGATGGRWGYGKIRRGNTSYNAHRLAYVAAKGPIGEGLQIDHLCRVPGCINPDHLEAVTPRQNVMRGRAPAKAAISVKRIHAERKLATHCKRGHEFTAENTGFQAHGKRFCRQCVSRPARWERKLLRSLRNG
jgi:hypothetical protein